MKTNCATIGVMWQEFLASLWDDEEEDWLSIDAIRWNGDDMELSAVIANEDRSRHRWGIRCHAVLASSISDVRGGGLQHIEDPTHPLVRAYAGDQAQLYFNGQSSDWFSVLGQLMSAHQAICGDWFSSDAYLRGGVDLLRGEHGLLAEGPAFVLEAYAEVLDHCGIKHSLIAHRPFKRWNGERFIEAASPQAIHFGDSWIVAATFEAIDLGVQPQDPTTDVPERYGERHIAPSIRARVAEAAGIGDAPGMGDWPVEVADPDRAADFISLFELEQGADERYAYMELILHSLDAVADEKRATVWPRVAEQLSKSALDFAYLIIYWSCVAEYPDGAWRPVNDPDEQFSLTHLMRAVLRDVAMDLNFHELDWSTSART